MITSVTKQIIEIIGEQIMTEVAAHPEVKDAENILNALMEIITRATLNSSTKLRTLSTNTQKYSLSIRSRLPLLME